MTRRKRSRKTGPLAISGKDKQRLRDERARGNEQKNRGKGSKAGSRQQTAAEAKPTQTVKGNTDPRSGSKKPIKLIQPGQAPVASKPKPSASDKLLSTEIPEDYDAIQQQLLALESDDAFMAQLEVVDEGGVLSPEQQQLFEQKLQRYELLLEKAQQLEGDDNDDQDPLAALMQDGAGFRNDWD